MKRGISEPTGTTALQRHPVKSARGGYLRCPFDIQPVFAEMANRHADGAFKCQMSSTMRGVETSNSEKDADINEVSRPWSRAGVGAKALSAKERRLQQQDAERIYGPIVAEDTGDDPSAPSCSPSHSTSINAGLGVALSNADKTALKRLLPRGVRRGKMQRNSGNTDAAPESDIGVSTQHIRLKSEGANLEGDQRSSPAEVGNPCGKIEKHGVLSGHSSEVGVSAFSQEVGQEPEKKECKPLNKLQRLDEMRTAALFERKKKMKRY